MVRLKAGQGRARAVRRGDFNSTMVRLKGVDSINKWGKSFNFNSTMVRLKDALDYIAITLIDVFQFHYGTIKSQMIHPINSIFTNFNSTMVRLKDFRIVVHLLLQHYFNSTMVRLKVP